jgi:D-amino-acid dehydrogenase
MARRDSPLYVQPRPDPAFVRWLLTFWRHCNERAYQAGLVATAGLLTRTLELYDMLRADGVAFEEHRVGVLYAFDSRAELEHEYAHLAPLRRFGYEIPPILDGDQMRNLEPTLRDEVAGGYWFAQERHVRPDDLVAGLVAWLRAAGVDVRAGQAVTGFERQGAKITAVVTTGGRFAAEAVVVCAGAWTPAVVRPLGVRIPIEAGKGCSLDWAPPPFTIGRPLYLHGTRVAVTPLDGRVRLAGTMELSGLNDRIRQERVAAIARAGARYIRGWPATPDGAAVWTGPRPMTPDGLPLIGLLPDFANLAVAAGHAMLGVTLAPATAEAVAELVTSGRTPEVLAPFNPARFR